MNARSLLLPLLLALLCPAISSAQWTLGNNGLNNTHLHRNQNVVVSPKIECAKVYSGTRLTDTAVACVPSGVDGFILFGPSESFWGVSFSNGIHGFCQGKDLVHPVPSVISFTASGPNLFAGTTDGVFRSSDNGRSWVPVDDGLLVPFTDYWYIHAMAALDTNLFIATAYGVYRSVDKGGYWNWANTGIPSPNPFVNTLIAFGTKLFASAGQSVYLSSNSGATWSKADSSVTKVNAIALAVTGTSIIAGTTDGIFRSANGSGWVPSNTGLPPSTQINCLAVSGLDLFAGTSNAGIYSSSDNGTEWTKRNEGMTNDAVRAFAVSGRTLFAATEGGGICVSSNNGVTWTGINDGLPNPYPPIYALMASATDLFAGTPNGVFRRPLSEIVTSIDQLPAIAYSFKLGQNYPNPFNPSTTIRYSLAGRSQVTLIVFNTLGQEAAVLQNGEQDAGYHEAIFVGSNLASGLYFYRLQAGSFVQTKKLLILR